MSTNRPIWKSPPLLAAAGGLFALVIATYAVWGLLSEGAETEAPSSQEQLHSTHLSAEWSTSPATRLTVELDPRRGPIWQRSDAEPLALTPQFPGVDLSWETTRYPSAVLVTGRGEWKDARLRVRWLFAKRDPQAELSIRLQAASLETMRTEKLVGRLRLPPAEISTTDDHLSVATIGSEHLPRRVGPWEPAWLRWRGSPLPLTISGWSGDGFVARRAEDGSSLAVDLAVWQPKLHPSLERCKPSENSQRGDPPRLTLQRTAQFTFGKAPRTLSSRFPDNRAAALVPLFDTPASHPDTTLHRGGADTPKDWAARARTLAYGHSNPEDPRYGNGGLLGHGLGGTLAVPADWLDSRPVTEFRKETTPSDLGVAVRGALPPDGSSVRTALTSEPACRRLLSDSSPGVVALGSDFSPFRDRLAPVDDRLEEGAPAWTAPSGPDPSFVRPLRLDGTRPQLVEEVFHPDGLDRLVASRSTAVVDTPFLATRNPLIPAAKEALLEPERHGRWTLSSAFAAALADLELHAEATPIAVSSLSRLVNHWRLSRRVTRRWNDSGELLVRAPEEESIRGYTLIVDGLHLPREAISVQEIERVEIRHAQHPRRPKETGRQTWISWDLDGGETYRLGFGEAIGSDARLAAVEWEFGD